MTILSGSFKSAVRSIDPRRSLVAGATWLIVALALTFSMAAAVWVGNIARQNVLEQHIRRLSLETDQLGTDLSQALAARLGAVRAAGSNLRGTEHANTPSGLSVLFEELRSAYPEYDWLAVADAAGTIVSATGAIERGAHVDTSSWFAAGSTGTWLGVIAAGGANVYGSQESRSQSATVLGDMATPVRDQAGRIVGVVAAHLSWRRNPNHPERLTDEADPRNATQAYVLDRDGVVIIGPDELRGKPWNGVALNQSKPVRTLQHALDGASTPQFERLPGGRQVLVSRAVLSGGSELPAPGWRVQLCEPRERVYQRADALALRILWVSLGLGAATALLGAVGARQLTARLRRVALSVAAVGTGEATRIHVPSGQDEAAQLAGAFAGILEDLQQERSELQALSGELERRVVVRTREVERLAEESRYAAIVRERLKIARDLHDTLAHSMMAMLSEIRFLRRLQVHDPAAVPDELARAEQAAHEGLKEARTAITQMRVSAVRETGLGPALSSAFERFIDHTGLTGEFRADPEAARFGDERAETLLRMAQEALRNVERHASATRVGLTLLIHGARLELSIEDDGVGFDPGATLPGHYGIVGLREQAELLGAELQIVSAPNQGTRLWILLPLSPIPFGH